MIKINNLNLICDIKLIVHVSKYHFHLKRFIVYILIWIITQIILKSLHFYSFFFSNYLIGLCDKISCSKMMKRKW